MRADRHRASLPAGFLDFDKPPGVTSHDVVDFVRALAGDRRVGHCGTLDPRARGVLPLALGAATRLSDLLVAATKSYRARALLDRRTATGDLDGEVTARFAGPGPDLSRVERALAPFRGRSLQAIPAFSAVRVGGERLYNLARRGEAPPRPVREIDVERLVLVDYAWPVLQIELTCSKGTYVRSLVEDIGAALGVGGALDELVRTAVGALDLAGAVTPWGLAATWIAGDLSTLLVPWERALPGTPLVTLADATAVARLRQGSPLACDRVDPAPPAAGTVLVLSPAAEPVALCEVALRGTSRLLLPRRVLVPVCPTTPRTRS
jgi:tRNA pseudouridine55 synthase